VEKFYGTHHKEACMMNNV